MQRYRITWDRPAYEPKGPMEVGAEFFTESNGWDGSDRELVLAMQPGAEASFENGSVVVVCIGAEGEAA